MFALLKLLLTSIWVGMACSVFAVGATGILIGIPLAFLEILPGEQLEELRQLPRDLIVAGLGGLAIGTLAGFASQLTSNRVSYIVSTAVVAACVVATIAWTHPNLNLGIESTLGDYLESYRLTVLAAIAGAITVFALGLLLKPFQVRKSRSA